MESGDHLFYAVMKDEPATAPYLDEKAPWLSAWPRHLVGHASWPGWFEDCDEEIGLLDFGEASPVGDTVTDIAQFIDLRSPETFFLRSFTY
jgi:hypothetical protein